MILISLNCH